MQTNGRPAFFNWTNRSARHHQETILLHLVVDLFAAGEIRSSAERCKRYRNVHDSPALVNRGALKRNSFPRLCCSRDSTISSPETNQYKPTCLDPGRKLKPRCWARDSCQASP
ncbi:Hypp4817 [Branchiostoma lanceolatum]|uniref:Hypp4817 protein n=1 Tax=Branchiostoma lanceolatum TaxID=7740 RepID=A0A8K0AB36_BRALA|nr:Hypp4817 [Branchiostoma lanceolatum]